MRRDGLGWRRMAGLGAQEGEMRLGTFMQIFRRVGGGRGEGWNLLIDGDELV